MVCVCGLYSVLYVYVVAARCSYSYMYMVCYV